MAFWQTDNLWINQLGEGVADLVLDIPGANVNLLNRVVLADLDAALTRIEADPSFQVLVLRSGKTNSFCHGLDRKELAAMRPAEMAALAATGQALCQRLAESRLPVMAVIAGTCLSTGLELALACDHRVVVDKPAAILGFDDLELGLIPFWGGTQRLPRIVGLERALLLLLGGRRLRALDALAFGLADEVIDAGDGAPPAFLERPGKHQPTRLPLRTLRQKLLESHRPGRWLIFRGTERLLRKRLPDDMPAPWACLAAVRTGLASGAAAGLEAEHAGAAELAETPAFRNLLHLHLERDNFRLSHARPASDQRIHRVGVLGAGDRGLQFALLAVLRGRHAVVRASSDMALGLAMFRLLALLQAEVKRGTLSSGDLMKTMSAIKGTTAWKGFEDVDMILDAGEHDAETLHALFFQAEKIVRSDTLLVSTNPTLAIQHVRHGLKRHERVAGLHFLPPLTQSALVEVVLADGTPDSVRRRLEDFVIALGRVPHLAPDRPGFLVMRLLFPYLQEAVLLVKEGYAPSIIDDAMIRFGMSDGPLEQLDLLGLDVAARLGDALAEELGARLPIDASLEGLAARGWLGQKVGLGFYSHKGRRRKENRALVSALQGQSRGGPALAVAERHEAIRKRLVWLMVNEAAWCLEEGRVDDAATLDFAMMVAGWAPHRGGPLQYARDLGRETVMGALAALAKEVGPRYAPCPALAELW